MAAKKHKKSKISPRVRDEEDTPRRTPSLTDLEKAARSLLVELGENPEREGLQRTPGRFAKAMQDLTAGYHQDPLQIVNGAIFHEVYDEMILVKDIEIFSLCEHHLLPFFGRCHIAYIPNGRIVGLSKLARIADLYAKRLQVQERLTEEIAHCINDILMPKGVAVVIEAKHLCMVMRGVQKQNSTMMTSAMFGEFRNDLATRNEFLKLVTSGK